MNPLYKTLTIFLLTFSLWGWIFVKGVRLQEGPAIHLSASTNSYGYKELSRKLDQLEDEIDTQQEESRHNLARAVKNSKYEDDLAERSIRSNKEKAELEEVKEIEDMKDMYKQEAEAKARDSEVSQKLSSEGHEISAVGHAERELLRRNEKNEKDMLEKEMKEAEREEKESRTLDQQAEENDLEDSSSVTPDDIQLEDTASEAYDEAEKTVKQMDKISAKVASEEEERELKSLESLNEETKAKLENNFKSNPETLEKNESVNDGLGSVMKGISSSSCPCVEEAIEQPCPNVDESGGSSNSRLPCDGMAEKRMAEEELEHVENEAYDVVNKKGVP